MEVLVMLLLDTISIVFPAVIVKMRLYFNTIHRNSHGKVNEKKKIFLYKFLFSPSLSQQKKMSILFYHDLFFT